MQYTQIIEDFQQRSGIKEITRATKIMTAVVETLAQRLPTDVRLGLISQLPDELKDIAGSPSVSEQFARDEFYRRISIRADVSPEDTPVYTTSAIFTLKDALSSGQIEKIINVLTNDYLILFHK